MIKEEIRNKMFEVRLALAMLSLKERENKEHPLYEEFNKLKRLYALALYQEKEKNENEQHKTK